MRGSANEMSAKDTITVYEPYLENPKEFNHGSSKGLCSTASSLASTNGIC